MAFAAFSVTHRTVLPDPSTLTTICSGSRDAGLGLSPAGKPAPPAHTTPEPPDARGITLMPAPAGEAVAGAILLMALPSTPDTQTLPVGSVLTSCGCTGVSVGSRLCVPPSSA